MITITTVTEGNGTVLSELLVDLEVDFSTIFLPLATQRQCSLAPLCRLVDGLAVRSPSARHGCAQAARAAKRSTEGPTERCTRAAERVLWTASR